MPPEPFMRCAYCGDRIGVYEALWVKHSDGELEASSYLNLPECRRRAAANVEAFHLGCLAPDAPEPL